MSTSGLPRYKITVTEDGAARSVRYAENETQAERVYGDLVQEFPGCLVRVEDRVEARVVRRAAAGLPPETPETDDRDPLCSECAHAPGEHPVASVVTYCDTKHEHEVRVITDGEVVYAYGTGPSGVEAPGVGLAASLLATETPHGGMVLEAPCPQGLSDGVDCPGYARWVLTADDFTAPLPADFRAVLSQHGKRVEV